MFFKFGCYILSFIVFAISGCTSTYPVAESNDKRNADELKYSSVNTKIQGYSVCVVLKDSTEYSVPEFQLGKDSSFIAVEGKQGFFIPTLTIASLRIAHHTEGALTGFLIGVMGGLGVGLLVAPSPEHSESGARFLVQGLAIAGIGVLGMTTGVIWGAVKGNQTVFEMK